MTRDYFSIFDDGAEKDILKLTEVDAYLDDLNIPPEAIHDFDYDGSAKRTQKIYKKWNQVTQQLLQEILIAYFALKDQKGEKSFSTWCKDAGLPEANLVRKWILRFLDPDKYTQVTQEKKVKVEQSAIEKTLKPIVDKMKVSLSDDGKKVIIEVFGKKFEKKLS